MLFGCVCVCGGGVLETGHECMGFLRQEMCGLHVDRK